jgi:AbiU2
MHISKVREDMLQAAIGAKAHYDVWWAQVSEGRTRFPAVLRQHSDFFGASQDAHYTAFFICFGRLFDKGRDNSSIATYLRLAKTIMPSAEHALLQSEFVALGGRAEPLLTIRHSLVAHVGVAFTERQVFQPLGITWNEIRARIHESSAFVARAVGAPSPGEVGIPRDGRLEEAATELFEALAATAARDA